jgi:hypothetical protein
MHPSLLMCRLSIQYATSTTSLHHCCCCSSAHHLPLGGLPGSAPLHQTVCPLETSVAPWPPPPSNLHTLFLTAPPSYFSRILPICHTRTPQLFSRLHSPPLISLPTPRTSSSCSCLPTLLFFLATILVLWNHLPISFTFHTYPIASPFTPPWHPFPDTYFHRPDPLVPLYPYPPNSYNHTQFLTPLLPIPGQQHLPPNHPFHMQISHTHIFFQIKHFIIHSFQQAWIHFQADWDPKNYYTSSPCSYPAYSDIFTATCFLSMHHILLLKTSAALRHFATSATTFVHTSSHFSCSITRRKLCHMQLAKERLRSYTTHIRLSS